MLKKILTFSFILFITTELLAQQNVQYVVYHKNGSIIRGTIVEYIPEVSLKIQTNDGNVFFFSMHDILKVAKESETGLSKPNSSDYKSPGLAFALSFLLPGCGQYYNGDITTGVIQQVLYVGGWTLFFALGWESDYSYDTYWNGDYYEYNYEYFDTETEWLYIGLGLAAGSAIWSWIDAPISANNINNRNRQNFGHLIDVYQGKQALGFDFGPTQKGLAVKLSYHF